MTTTQTALDLGNGNTATAEDLIANVTGQNNGWDFISTIHGKEIHWRYARHEGAGRYGPCADPASADAVVITHYSEEDNGRLLQIDFDALAARINAWPRAEWDDGEESDKQDAESNLREWWSGLKSRERVAYATSCLYAENEAYQDGNGSLNELLDRCADFVPGWATDGHIEWDFSFSR